MKVRLMTSEGFVRKGLGGALMIVVLMATAGCGQQDDETPSAPGVSRAEPTGTVNTTVPPTTTTRG